MAEPRQIGRQVRRGLSWNLVGAIATNVIRLAVVAILGRALTSADFGVVAAAISVNVILYGIRDIGLGRALIQREDLDVGHRRTSFAISTYLGVVLTVVLLVGAPAIGRVYGIPGSVDVIRALALLFVFRGVAMTSRMLCERDLQFRVVAIIDTISFALGSATSVALALAGMGPWSLVIGYLVEELSSTIAYLVAKPPTISWRIERDKLRELMSFGTGQTLTQLFTIAATYGDNLVVGEVMGASALGFYTRAYDLIKMPSMVFEAIVAKVLFPAFSRLQNDRDRVQVAFERVMFANALVLLPASAALLVTAPEVVRILVGEGWDSSVLPLRILTFSMLPRTSQKLGILVAQAVGRSNAVAVANAVYMIFVIGGAAITVRWGIAGVAVSTSLALVVVFAHASALGIGSSGLPLRKFAMAHVPGALLAALVVGVTWPIANILRADRLSAVAIFGIVLALSIAICVGVIAALLRRPGNFSWLRGELRRVARLGPKVTAPSP